MAPENSYFRHLHIVVSSILIYALERLSSTRMPLSPYGMFGTWRPRQLEHSHESTSLNKRIFHFAT